MGRGGEILVLLAVENVGSNQVDLGVTVLARLGGRHVHDLARTALNDNEAVLAQSRALHGEGERSAGIGRVELELMLLRKQVSGCCLRFDLESKVLVVVVGDGTVLDWGTVLGQKSH